MSEKINFGLVLKESAALPMVRIDRESFLKTALSPHFDEDTVCKAISVNPAYAGITTEEIKKIARSCINYETTKVTTLSFAAGIPGGFAMIGAVPADLVQYFGHVLRIAQKLIYLYGWQELFDESGQMDDGTANLLTLFIGVMFGVNGAASAIVKISEAAAQKAAKSLAQKALTIYPSPGIALVCNEDGWVRGLPGNRGLRDETGEVHSIIWGTFFLCGAPADGEDFVGLTPEQAEQLEKQFHTPEAFVGSNGRILCVPLGLSYNPIKAPLSRNPGWRGISLYIRSRIMSIGREDYAERKEARIERLESRAAKAQAESTAACRRSTP